MKQNLNKLRTLTKVYKCSFLIDFASRFPPRHLEASRPHTKNVFPLKPSLLSWIGPYLLYMEPEGGKSNALSLGVVDTFSVFSRHHAKNVFPLKPCLLSGIRPYLLHMEPEGGKENALYHWVLWTLFQCFLDIMPKTFFL